MTPYHAELAIHDAPLARPVASARGTWTSRRGVLLALRDADGLVGRGEASPLPGYSPDDADACARALERYAPLGDPHVPDLAHLPAARFALETALADIEAQRRGTSLAVILGAGARSTGARSCSTGAVLASGLVGAVGRAGLVDLASPSLEDDARALVSRAIGTIKAKIGARPLDDDLAALARLRGAVGPSVRLRLDANGAFDATRARAVLASLARFEPELVEEPARGDHLLALGACDVPWAADESLQDPRLAARLLDAPCAAFVVKPALHGLSGARALALAAQSHGKAVVVTHLFDGPVALAAACELAVSLPDPILACGLDVHAGLAAWRGARVPQLDEPGVIVASARPGLAVEFA